MKHDLNRRRRGGALLPAAVIAVFLRLETCGHRAASKQARLRAQPERFFATIRSDLLPSYYL
ncbi:MAG: hypothetical protein ABJF10_21620 [Chthoniobacter sp.]|uniref:hypothetical protein n=1 Tax=Chthoniobacter sp. TaxID=2510640 RepID=UPI0032A54E13